MGRRADKRASAWAVSAAALLLAGTVSAGETAAQERREGQWLTVGVGAGFDQVACQVCASDFKSGLAGLVRFGGTLSPRLLIGVEVDGWTRRDEEVRQYLGSLGPVLLWYADATARFHVKLGAGAVGFRASQEGEALTAVAFGVNAGLGYDHPITGSLSVTPFANLVLAPFATLKLDGEEAVSGATLGLVQAGLGITWH